MYSVFFPSMSTSLLKCLSLNQYLIGCFARDWDMTGFSMEGFSLRISHAITDRELLGLELLEGFFTHQLGAPEKDESNSCGLQQHLSCINIQQHLSCINIQQLIYPFYHWWAFGLHLRPLLICCHEHVLWCAYVCTSWAWASAYSTIITAGRDFSIDCTNLHSQ